MSTLPQMIASYLPSEEADTTIVAFFQMPSKIQGQQAKLGAVRGFFGEGRQGLVSVGLGLEEKASLEPEFLEKIRLLGGSTWSRLVSEKCRVLNVKVDSFCWKGSLAWVGAFAEGLILASYRFHGYRSVKKDEKMPRFVFHTQDKKQFLELKRVLGWVDSVGEAVAITRNWSNEPSNWGTPVTFAEQAKQLARKYGLKCSVMTEKQIKSQKMDLFLAVGQGSHRESRWVVLEYIPKKAYRKTVALVGKGVTFDSGGISLKPALKMEEMKHDMTGAATVLGATLLAAWNHAPVRILTYMPFTENMPGGGAIQPGNVIRARSGKTVEIVNTDAEGRLILADALDFAQDAKPDVLIDVATLTGAVSIALGKQCCAILGNDGSLIQKLKQSARIQGEKIWELPLFEEYFEDLKSDVADMKNVGNDGCAGVIRGASFLKEFIRKKTIWAHLDIASTAYHMSHLSYCPKRGASGAYVRSLAEFLIHG